MRLALLATMMLGLSGAAVVAAEPTSAWVDFTSKTIPPSAFAIKQAKARGIELEQEPGSPLRGLLVRPEGDGPFPALVMLHGCDGIQPFQERLAEELATSGYVTLLVDSNGAAGVGRDCDHWPGKANNRSLDAFGAFDYLSNLADVDSGRIGVLGWDTGGLAVMRVLSTGGEQLALPERFAAGVALYPVGRPVPPMSAPLLILMGEKDDCSPTERVQRFVQADQTDPYPIRIEILAGVGHGFDDPRFAEPVEFTFEQVQNCFYSGTTMAYSQVARDAAVKKVGAFLEEALN